MPAVGIVGGVLVGLLVAAIIGYQVATWDKIAPGVVALSPNLGGLEQEQRNGREMVIVARGQQRIATCGRVPAG